MAACVAVLLPASPAAADVTSVTGNATGVTVTGTLGTIPPTPAVSLSANEASPASAFGPFTGSAPSVNLPSPFPFNLFSTGALSVMTTARNVVGPDEAGLVEAGALVQNVVLGPNVATATSIASSCTANGREASGATTIQGGMLNGQPFPPTPAPAPNTVVPVPGIGTVTLNEQTATSSVAPDGTTNRRIVVNAVHARFESGAGGILPSGDQAEAIIASVTCEATEPAPAPTTTTMTVPPTSTTTSPKATTTTVPRGRLADSGSESALPVGVVAIGLGASIRLAIRSSARRRSAG